MNPCTVKKPHIRRFERILGESLSSPQSNHGCMNLEGKNLFQIDMARFSGNANSNQEMIEFIGKYAADLAKFYCSNICPLRRGCQEAKKSYRVDPVDELHDLLTIHVVPVKLGNRRGYSLD